MSRAFSAPAPMPDAGAVLAAAPILVIVPSSTASLTTDAEPKVLGLSLVQRTVLAAHAAGYGRVFYLALHDAALPGVVAVGDWNGVAAIAGADEARSLIIVPATILAETGWLARLAAPIDAPVWAAAPGRVIVLPVTSMREALALLDAGEGAYDLVAVQDRLTRRFGPPIALPTGIDPMVVATPADIRRAERRLLRSVVKDTDGFMTRHVERPISLAVSRLLAPTAVTPNQMTLVSAAIGVAAGPFFLSARVPWQTVGALLFLAHSILDGCDGELARLKFQTSRWGGILDFWGDNAVHCVIFACMAVGWSRATGEALPLLAGAAAVTGTLASAGFVHWRVLRPKQGPGPLYTSVSSTASSRLTKMLDGLSRRDFIYLVLAFALFGKASWFLLLTAIGAPIFFLLLVFIAWREGVAARSSA